MMDSFIDQKNRGSAVSGAIVFFLVGVFAFFSVVMVLLAAHTYKNTHLRSDENGDKRVLHHYIVNAVQAADRENAICTDEKNGVKRLVIYPDDETGAEMSIYAYGGNLLEIYLSKGDEFIPEYGEVILPLKAFEPIILENLLTVLAEDEYGEKSEIHVSLSCRQGGKKP